MVKDGEIDLDLVTTDLWKKAQNVPTGVTVSESDFNSVLQIHINRVEKKKKDALSSNQANANITDPNKVREEAMRERWRSNPLSDEERARLLTFGSCQSCTDYDLPVSKVAFAIGITLTIFSAIYHQRAIALVLLASL